MKKIIVVILSLVMILGLSACGKPATLTITDDGLVTEIETKIPNTVDKILTEAGISLNEGDVVTPELGTKISEPQEIVIERIHTVKLTVGGKTESYDIVGGTVADLIKEAGVTVEKNQTTSIGLDEALKEGMEVKIIDKFAVSITCDGKTEESFVTANNVGDALVECGITLGEDDRVEPTIDKAITDGMEIVVERVKVEEVVEIETIDYDVVYEYDNSKAIGYESTRVYGEAGEKEIKYKVSYVNGEEEDREVIEEKIIKEPISTVIVCGPYVVSRKDCPNCGIPGGYYEITYSNGEVEYEEYD